MAVFKTIPELVRINGKWTIEPFEPKQAAFDWESNRGQKAVLYVLACEQFHKIGITTKFETRLRSLESSNPFPITKVAVRNVPKSGVAYVEAWLHMKLADYRVKGEWFSAPRTEIMALLPYAVRRAVAYDERCRQWHYEDVAKWSTPENKAKMREGYRNFLDENIRHYDEQKRNFEDRLQAFAMIGKDAE